MKREVDLVDLEKSKLSVKEIDDVLNSEKVGYLALARDGQPYLVPLNFIYNSGKIYFHSRTSGRKVETINLNPKAAFHAGAIGSLIAGKNPCKFNYNFSSVVVEGAISEVRDLVEKEAILELLVEKYAGNSVSRGKISAKQLEGVNVYCLEPCITSGKKNT